MLLCSPFQCVRNTRVVVSKLQPAKQQPPWVTLLLPSLPLLFFASEKALVIRSNEHMYSVSFSRSSARKNKCYLSTHKINKNALRVWQTKSTRERENKNDWRRREYSNVNSRRDCKSSLRTSNQSYRQLFSKLSTFTDLTSSLNCLIITIIDVHFF